MARKHIVRKKKSKSVNTPLIIVLACIAVVIGIILINKEKPSSASTSATGEAEITLARLIEEGEPVFVFYHSTDCYTCKVMMATVAEVFPEYEDSIELVDVNVYDPANQNLLQKAQIRSIPTQVFYNNKGESTVIIGVMEPDALRLRLKGLIDG